MMFWFSLPGFPVLQHFTKKKPTNQGGFNLGGINATGQVPKLPGNLGLIDKDTPQEAYTKKSYTHPDQVLQLVFSDEFNQDGRTFYPGDDPFWEAMDLHYWGTVGCCLTLINVQTELCWFVSRMILSGMTHNRVCFRVVTLLSSVTQWNVSDNWRWSAQTEAVSGQSSR